MLARERASSRALRARVVSVVLALASSAAGARSGHTVASKAILSVVVVGGRPLHADTLFPWVFVTDNLRRHGTFSPGRREN